MAKAKRPEIIDVGEAIFGPAWQEKLAEALGVSSKTVWRWKNGAWMPDVVWHDIAEIAEGRSVQLDKLAKVIRKLHPPA